ncbi:MULTISPECIES: malonate transporter subunit MadL [Burkholderia]|uniref:Malonate transporter subunit MadL n=1 Tax=Burkholderia gladioli TaxID=28095 RepID=A0AAW7RF24_BURGA|nr:malonate transporter subunit MadL [Burkholderia gladioli]NBI50180.1 malonate transporter subunit MadL [Burkholderia sp. ISTR5]ASD80377.1 malonate transporter subunit MadL [Burkholderia gladioli pv. gladioli]AWY54381.1 malonate transporter subunit MadL [Burkholderia gladioli pv. gladioli]KGC11348.1 malonate transporter, MadL subunit [Burkholderia gladioli]MBA1366406.1 malonate transporter subunit MadL [Burkholderia gladioli]
MIIYGTAMLAVCYLAGLAIGDLLGLLIGTSVNVGGVGISMILLIALRWYLCRKGALPAETDAGVGFWRAMYIPVTVAMAASQDVSAAISGGLIALLAALAAIFICAFAIAILARTGRDTTSLDVQMAHQLDARG